MTAPTRRAHTLRFPASCRSFNPQCTRRLYIRLTAVCPVPCAMYHVCFVFLCVYRPVVVLTPLRRGAPGGGDGRDTRRRHLKRCGGIVACWPSYSLARP